MVGLPQEHEQQQELERENNLHHDLVQGNILDTYHNLTFKSVMGHLWVSEFCRQAEVVVKADDDIYLDLYGIYTVATRYFQDQVRSLLNSPSQSQLDTSEVQGQYVHDGDGQQAALDRGHQVRRPPLEQVVGVLLRIPEGRGEVPG